MGKYAIDETTLTSLANAARALDGSAATLTPSQIVGKMGGFFTRAFTGDGTTAATFAAPFDPDVVYVVIENGQTYSNCTTWYVYNKATESPYKGFFVMNPNNAAVLGSNSTAPVYDAQNKTLTVYAQTSTITNRPFCSGATYRVFGFAIPAAQSRGGLRTLAKGGAKAGEAAELPLEDCVKEETR